MHLVNPRDKESVKHAYADVLQTNDAEHDELTAELGDMRDAKNNRIGNSDDRLARKLFTQEEFYDLASASEMIERHIRGIFTREYGLGSYELKTKDSRGNRDINDSDIARIPLLYSIGGVGKTAMIDSVLSNIFNNPVSGTDKYHVVRDENYDDDDEMQYSDDIRLPKIITIKCQGLKAEDIHMPAKGEGQSIVDELNRNHVISKEAVRQISTGLIPMIDTIGIDEKEIEEIDRAMGPILIILDELFMAQEDALEEFMAFAKERRVTSWVLPSRCAFIATSNRSEDFNSDSITAETITQFLRINIRTVSRLYLIS